MAGDLVEVRIMGLVPSNSGGIAVFLGNDKKTFSIHVDQGVGMIIALLLRGEKRERPLTHDLIKLMFQAFSVTVQKIVINDLKNETYYARITLIAKNEVHQKISEIDARPSDCLAIALETKTPIHVSSKVWNEVEDTTYILENMKQKFEDFGGFEDEGPESKK